MHRPRSPWTDCRLHIHIHEALRCLISGGFLCASTQAKECMPAGKGRRAACLPMYIHIHTHIHGGTTDMNYGHSPPVSHAREIMDRMDVWA